MERDKESEGERLSRSLQYLFLYAKPISTRRMNFNRRQIFGVSLATIKKWPNQKTWTKSRTTNYTRWLIIILYRCNIYRWRRMRKWYGHEFLCSWTNIIYEPVNEYSMLTEEFVNQQRWGSWPESKSMTVVLAAGVRWLCVWGVTEIKGIYLFSPSHHSRYIPSMCLRTPLYRGSSRT